MEIIRRDSDYGIRALLYLARVGKALVPCAQVAAACGIPKSFAYKILRKLVGAGVVASRVGRPGGFRLRKKPERISLATIIETMQGPISVAKCIFDSRICRGAETCVFAAKLRELHEQIVRFLKQTTLKDLMAPSKRVRCARSRAR